MQGSSAEPPREPVVNKLTKLAADVRDLSWHTQDTVTAAVNTLVGEYPEQAGKEATIDEILNGGFGDIAADLRSIRSALNRIKADIARL